MRVERGNGVATPRRKTPARSLWLRFIPDHELDKLMSAIDAIACPFQRAALLVARWSGARRTEIQKLPIDCLGAC